MALDSLYGAYLKATYPLEYFSVVLNIYKKSKTKQSELINELSHFDIVLDGIKFGKSKSEYSFDKDTRTIYKGISTIAYMNESVANGLYELGKNKYDKNDWVRLILDIIEGSIADNRQMNILINLGYFDMFGDVSVLLEVFNTVTGYQNKKINPVISNGEKLDVKYSKTHKEPTKQKRIPMIQRYYELVLLNKDLLPKITLFDKLQYEIEYMGYATTIDMKAPNDRYVVMSVMTQYTPVYKLYHLFDGSEAIYKIDKKKAYAKNVEITEQRLIVDEGDIIDLTETSLRPKMQLVDGKWIKNEDVMQSYIERVKIVEKRKV